MIRLILVVLVVAATAAIFVRMNSGNPNDPQSSGQLYERELDKARDVENMLEEFQQQREQDQQELIDQ
ncbi:MAG: hypothetical protein ACWA5K_08130 [bacterium]